MAANNDDDDDDLLEMWDENVADSCQRLRQKDASLKSVLALSEYADQVCSALRANTVVERLSADLCGMPRSALADLNHFLMTSPSLKEFEFNTANVSESLLHLDRGALPLANLMLFAICGPTNSIETLANVPLCPATALAFCNVLRINDKLRNLSIDFPFEPTLGQGEGDLEDEDDSDDEDEEDDDNVTLLVRNSLGPEVAQALSLSNVQSMSLNWLEHSTFRTGKAFFAALPGCLPGSLRHLEFNNFLNSNVIARALSNMIEQSATQLDSILLSCCKFSDENFRQVLGTLAWDKPNLKVLHYGFLHEGTALVLAQSIGAFADLVELGVGIYKDMEAFELFCQKLAHNETIKTLDVRLIGVSKVLDRFLRALAIVMPKLPNLCSITTNRYTYNDTPVEQIPMEFLSALEAHEHLVNFLPCTTFADNKVEYCLTRNHFRDQLTATKPVMVEALRALDDGNPISLTLVMETLCSRDDWFREGADQGKPMPPTSAMDEAPTFRRFRPGLLF